MILMDSAGFCDRQIPVLSTIGKGPRGEKGEKGTVDEQQVMDAVTRFVEEHPEYVTTVEDGAVTEQKLHDDSVTTPKIADGSVTFPKLSDDVHTGYVRSFGIVDDMVVAADLADGMICKTSGYDSPGDGKGCAYRIVSEASTTIPIEDIVFLDNGLFAIRLDDNRYIEVVKDYDGLLLSKADLVYVLDMSDGPFGINSSCMFEVIKDTGRTYIQRNNRDYMTACPNQVPIPPSNAPSVSLGDCMASYIGRTDLVYGNNNTLFDLTCTNEIDCSSFAQACLYGITYENSRYNPPNQTNTLGSYVGDNYLKEYTIGQRMHALSTYRMAEWFAEQKRLFKFPETGDYRDAIHQLSFGDILFSTAFTYENRLYDIDHCMIVLKVFDDGHLLVAQGGGGGTKPVNTVCNIALIDFKENYGEGKKYRVFARPDYGDTVDLPTNLSGCIEKTNVITTTSEVNTNQRLGYISGNRQLDRNKMYTIILDGQLPDPSNGVYLRVSGSSSQVATLPGVSLPSGHISIPFVPQKDAVNDITPYSVNFHQTSDVVSGETYWLDGAALVHGVVGDADLSRSVSVVANPDNANISNFQNKSFIDGATGRFHLNISFKASGTAGTSDSQVVAIVEEPGRFPGHVNPAAWIPIFPIYCGTNGICVGTYSPAQSSITMSRNTPTADEINSVNRIMYTMDNIVYTQNN